VWRFGRHFVLVETGGGIGLIRVRDGGRGLELESKR
jgi:hypothetical protein